VHALHDVGRVLDAEAERVVERRERPLRRQRVKRIEERELRARSELAVRDNGDAGLNAVVVELQPGDKRTAAIAHVEPHHPQLERLRAAVGDAEIAVHRLAVQRALQERLCRNDGDLQSRRLCS
jgi:hypothetical protein